MLLQKLRNDVNYFLTVHDYFSANSLKDDKNIILMRHDVDRMPGNSLTLAMLENSFGIKGTYYFRIVPESFNEKIINDIRNLGHEIGYHYEEMDLVYRKRNKKQLKAEEIVDEAYELFTKNLSRLRAVADVKTICMHGSPLSPFDNKFIWSRYNYRDLGIICEPYFDINWKEFAYLTDTGRRWNGGNVSVRDKVSSGYNYDFRSTNDIIMNITKLPLKIMFTIHPERWNDRLYPWVSQLLLQNVKNIVKKAYLVKK